MVRTVGIEEELLLVDPGTGSVSPRSSEVVKRLVDARRGAPGSAADELDQELFGHQVETRTDPHRHLADLRAQVVAARRTAGRAAREADLAAVACGVVPRPSGEPVVSPDPRYRDIVERFGDVARAAGTCGMHVHVDVGSDEEGVAVIDRIAPWLPVLVAVSANSPYAEDRDTGYASWRAQVWSRWPTAGPTERFGDVETYRRVGRWLVESGAARDEKMLYLDARLATAQPTLEVRVADVCTDLDDAVLVAALARGLVETAARAQDEDGPATPWRAEMLRAAHWRASRHGTSGRLVHPVGQDLRPAREVLEALVGATREALEEAGDLDLVTAGLDRVVAGGGAARQRAAFERTGGVRGVVDDLVQRTEASWADVGATGGTP